MRRSALARRSGSWVTVVLLGICAGLGLACATRSTVDVAVGQLGARVDRLTREIEGSTAALAAEEHRVLSLESAAASAGAEAEIARRTAAAAHDVAAGSLLGEVMFAVDGLRFAAGSGVPGPASRSVLDQLANRLRLGDLSYRLEILGYGDVGATAGVRGRELGETRALAVRQYLVDVHALSSWRLQHLGLAARSASGDDVARASEVVIVVRR